MREYLPGGGSARITVVTSVASLECPRPEEEEDSVDGESEGKGLAEDTSEHTKVLEAAESPTQEWSFPPVAFNGRKDVHGERAQAGKDGRDGLGGGGI